MHAPGLWSWSVDDATSLYHEAAEGIVVADPLVPADEAERFWRALDRDVERIGHPPSIVVSSARTVRSAEAVSERYPGAAIYAPPGVPADLGARPLEDGDILPGGLVVARAADGVLLRCTCHGLLWTGDLLHADGAGGLAPAQSLVELDPAERASLAERLTDGDVVVAISALGSAVITAPQSAVIRALT